MESDAQDDDLGIYSVPINAPAANTNNRSQRLGQQRIDFNISPPTIPRSDLANINIFQASAFSNTSSAAQNQTFSWRGVRSQPFPSQQHIQGQIPSYGQEGDGEATFSDQELFSNLRWQSRIVPQAHFEGSERHVFTPLHSSSNEESKLAATTNPISPVGVTSPGFVNFASPLNQRFDNVSIGNVPQYASSITSTTATGTSASSENVDSETRGRRRREARRTPVAQSRAKTPVLPDTATTQGDTGISTSSSDPRASKSPPPQNLRGDPFRSAKVKTELCRHYNTPKGCPFGDKCNYAHGEHELKFTKLMDLERAGLIDVEIFRAHPCPTWVATGACPFDQRCIGLHDPRVEADPSNQAWLPHAETLINKIANGNNVDKFYHERLTSVYNSCPIYGYIPKHNPNEESNKTENELTWRHFYDFVCNLENNKQYNVAFDSAKHNLQDLSEEHKLEIVLKMRQRKSSQSYGYIPTHLFCGELCMILQDRTFQIVSVLDKKQGYFKSLEEVSVNQTAPFGAQQFQVYEIAFGPIGDPTVRPPSVWFDIPKDDLTPCTIQQAKHHKRSRHRIKKLSNRANPIQGDPAIGEKFKTIRIPPFFNYQPLDQLTFDLITRILVHRLKMVKWLTGKFDNSLPEVGQLLESERIELQQRFLCLLRSWVINSWPEELLQEPIHDETDVPSVSGKYSCSVEEAKFNRSEECYGLCSKRHLYNLPLHSKYLPCILWRSFTTNMLVSMGRNIDHIREETVTDYDDIFSQFCRLPILRSLSMGDTVNKNRYLSHIRTSRGIGHSSLSHCIEELLEEWVETKSYYTENNSNAATTIWRPSNDSPGSPSANESSNMQRLQRHLKSSVVKWTKLAF